ncbi:xylA, partial [Symbiodinium pilosum]
AREDDLLSGRSLSPPQSLRSDVSRVSRYELALAEEPEDPPEVVVLSDNRGVYAHHLGKGESVWLHKGQKKKANAYEVRRHSKSLREYIYDKGTGDILW